MDIEEINIKNITYSHYSECIQKAIEKFESVDGILSLYKFGTVNAPGVSDIDLIFVIKPSRKVGKNIFSILENDFSRIEKYILYQHDPLVIGSDLVNHINYIRECSYISYLFGQKFDIEEIDNIQIKLYMLIELLVYYYPNIFYRRRALRLRLQHINAFRYILNLFYEISKYYNFFYKCDFEMIAHEILQENDELRKNYLEQRNQNFAKCLRKIEIETISLIYKINTLLREFLKNIVPNSDIKKKCLSNIIFTEDYSSNSYSLNFFSRQIIFSEQPIEYYYFFSNTLPKQFAASIKKRNALVKEYCNFINTYVDGRSLYYPWWYRNKYKRLIKYIFSKGCTIFPKISHFS